MILGYVSLFDSRKTIQKIYLPNYITICLMFQNGKEKQAVPIVQLNVIHLLADLNVSVKKPEVVDMILPLFIESLEEGDASAPGLLRLRVRKFSFWHV